jgi:hypothetical protein
MTGTLVASCFLEWPSTRHEAEFNLSFSQVGNPGHEKGSHRIDWAAFKRSLDGQAEASFGEFAENVPTS